jgi:hypothetical protein
MARRFMAADGWKEGDPAPADAFRALGADRETPVGPVLDEHPGGYARQIAVKGEPVTADVLAELRSVPADETDEQPTPADKPEKG